MCVHRGFTLIEALFALSILLSAYCMVYTSISSIMNASKKVENDHYYSNMLEVMNDQFYPVTDLESTLEEIIENE